MESLTFSTCTLKGKDNSPWSTSHRNARGLQSHNPTVLEHEYSASSGCDINIVAVRCFLYNIKVVSLLPIFVKNCHSISHEICTRALLL